LVIVVRLKQLSGTSLVVSELGFGAWAIGGDSYGMTDDRVSAQAIQEALNLGCNLFDTADIYGGGHSEKLLGRTLRDTGRLNSVVVATKGGAITYSGARGPDFSKENICRSLEASLGRLGRDFVDIYQIHNPPLDVIRAGEIFEALVKLRDRGLIRFFGVSAGTVAEARASLANSETSVLQMTYNIFSLLNSDMSLDQLGQAIKNRDAGLLSREPLANGFLSGKHHLYTSYGEKDRRATWPTEVRRQRICLAEALRPLEREGVTLAQIAIRFALDEPMITSVLVGNKTPEQVRENFSSVNLPSFSDIAAGF
jgi:aryl-alcohol dehydrogenase-like predicted oxidoreductase